MNSLLLFMILAARNSDGEETGWSQILVFVLLAVFWAIGGIMKARAEKTRRQKEQEEPPVRPRPRPSQKPQYQRFQRPAKPVSETVEQRPKPSRPKIRPQQWPGQAKKTKPGTKPGVLSEPSKVAEAKKPLAKEKAATGLVSVAETFPVFEDSESLKAAILHYEILGKPLSLRGSEGQLWAR